MYFFPHVCCVCNSSNGKIKNVKSKDGTLKIIDKLENCVPEIIDLKSPCSENICQKCLSKLNNLYEFKLNCIKTHRTLYDYAKELDANDHDNSELQVEVELSIKSEPIQPESLEEEMVTVYSVELIKELEDPEDNIEESTREDNLRSQLTQIAESFTNFANTDCNSDTITITQGIASNYIVDSYPNSENLSISQDLSVYNPYAEINDSDSDFTGFTNHDIEISSVVAQRALENMNILVPRDKNPELICQVCGESFDTVVTCKEHELMHADVKPNVCIICMEVLGPHIKLRDHIQIHFKTLVKRTCDLCNDIFPTSSELHYHKIVQHGLYSYSCHICNKLYTTKLALTTHVNTHKRPEQDLVQCTKCSKKFTSSTNCKRHYKIVHERIKPFKCHLCNKSFAMKHYLKKHLDCHTGIKPYQCTLCLKCFRYQESLTHHIKIHNKYKCPLCDDSFMTFKLMREHERQHRTDLPYNCNFCNKNFKLASHLSNHISHKHIKEIKPFVEIDVNNENKIIIKESL